MKPTPKPTRPAPTRTRKTTVEDRLATAEAKIDKLERKLFTALSWIASSANGCLRPDEVKSIVEVVGEP